MALGTGGSEIVGEDGGSGGGGGGRGGSGDGSGIGNGGGIGIRGGSDNWGGIGNGGGSGNGSGTGNAVGSGNGGGSGNGVGSGNGGGGDLRRVKSGNLCERQASTFSRSSSSNNFMKRNPNRSVFSFFFPKVGNLSSLFSKHLIFLKQVSFV